MEYNGETFRGIRVRIDGNAFKGCHFENIVYEYGGGLCSFSECTFAGTSEWAMDGDLARGLETMRQFHHLGGPKAVKTFVDGISAMLRRKDAPQTFTVG